VGHRESRIRQVHRLPWPIPATVVVRLTDADLDDLDLAERTGRDACEILRRTENLAA
jgi:hypothetical protein